MKPYLKYYLISLLVIVIDQAVKLTVKFNMAYNEEIPIFGDWFKLHFIENPGAAFGVTLSNIFGGLSPVAAKLILSIFSILAVGVIGYILYRVSTRKNALPLFVSLIFGGAIGNIIDRVFYGVWFAKMNDYQGSLFHGRVVDMFYFDVWEGFVPESIPIIGGQYMSLYPIFNVADSAISIGIVCILLFQGKLMQDPIPPTETPINPITPVSETVES